MQIYLGVAFIAAVIALCAGIHVRMDDLSALLQSFHSSSLKQMATHKEKKLIGSIQRTKTMMAAIGQENKFYFLLAVSMALFVIGFTVGISFDNYFLSPVLAVGFAAIPFTYIRFQHIKYNKLVVEELETALSLISISYERTENVLTAVEENLENINMPIKQTFQEFVQTVTYIDPSLENAIDEMKRKINHSVFLEWCDALKRCVNNRGLKYTLRPIVSKLTEINIVTSDLKNILYKSVRTFWQLLALTVGLLVIGIEVLPNSMDITLPTTIKNIIIAINVLLIIVAVIRVSIETQDIKFDI